MKLYVNTTTQTYNDETPTEPYGDWYWSGETTIDSVSLTPDSNYFGGRSEDFNVPFDVKIGDTVYVLYMVYTSGDSFGYSEGNFEVIWIFKDVDLAHEACKKYNKISDDEDSYDNSYSISVKVDGGQILTLSNPAAGYFENMTSCDVKAFVVEP